MLGVLGALLDGHWTNPARPKTAPTRPSHPDEDDDDDSSNETTPTINNNQKQRTIKDKFFLTGDNDEDDESDDEIDEAVAAVVRDGVDAAEGEDIYFKYT